MADELFEVRNSYILGNYHQTIAEGSMAKTVSKKPEEVQQFNTERDALVALAQVGLGQWEGVLAELKNAASPLLIAVKHWAGLQKELAQKGDITTSSCLQELTAMVKDEKPNAALVGVASLACSAMIIAKDYSNALKFAHAWATGLDQAKEVRQVIEMRTLVVDGYLRLNRPDLAEKEVATMQKIDDEATATILMNGIVSLRNGVTQKSKYTEAVSAFNDLAARCGHSVMTLNLLALANVGLGKVQEAERNLLDALAKKSQDPDTIANLVMVASQLAKPSELTARYVMQVKTSCPNSVWAKQYALMEDRFREASAEALLKH